jgi:hypothetical protein
MHASLDDIANPENMEEADNNALLAKAKINFARIDTLNFQAACKVRYNGLPPIQSSSFMDLPEDKKLLYLNDPKCFTSDYATMLDNMEDFETDASFKKVIREAKANHAAVQLADAAQFMLCDKFHNGTSTIFNTMDLLDRHPDVAPDGQDRRNQQLFGGSVTVIGFLNASEEHSKASPMTHWESTKAVVTRRQLSDNAMDVKIRGKEYAVKCLAFCISMLLAQDIRSYAVDYQAIQDALSDLINSGTVPVDTIKGKNNLPLGLRVGGACWSPRVQDMIDMMFRLKLANGLKDNSRGAPDGRSHTQFGNGTRGPLGLCVITGVSLSRDSRVPFGGSNMQGSGSPNSHTHYLNPVSVTTGDTMREYPAITPILMALITKFARAHSQLGYVPTAATQTQFGASTFPDSEAGEPTREQAVALAVSLAPRAPTKKRKTAPLRLLDDDETEAGSKRTSTASRQLLSITATAPNGNTVANFADLTRN